MGVIITTRRPMDDSANVGIDMSDSLAMLDPSDVPLLSLIGKDGLTAQALKHEWLEDSLRPLDTLLATQGEFSGTGAVSTAAVTAGQGVYLRAGDILLIESELVLLASISTDTINIAAGGRGYGGSTAASHAATTPIKLVGNVNLTDIGQGASRTTTHTGRYNYCQLYEDTIVTTSTTQAIKKWVEQNDLDAQVARALKTAWMLWERTLYFGRKVQPTASVAGAMDGIIPVITTNAYAKSSAYLIEDFVLQAMQDSWNAGGHPDTIVVNAFQKRQLNKFLDSQRMTTRTDRVAGAIVDTYSSDFGTADIVLSRQAPADTVLVLDRARVKFGPLTGHPLSAAPVETSTRLKQAIQIVGQYTSELRNENAHAKITGLATS
jgi:hypothetical protein